MTNRYSDLGTGRFLTRDPIGYGGGINLYGFVGNNPVTGADPEGTDGEGLLGRFGRWFIGLWAPTMKPGTPTLQTPHPELQSLMDDPTVGGLIGGYGSGVRGIGHTLRRNLDYTVGYAASEIAGHGVGHAIGELGEAAAGGLAGRSGVRYGVHWTSYSKGESILGEQVIRPGNNNLTFFEGANSTGQLKRILARGGAGTGARAQQMAVIFKGSRVAIRNEDGGLNTIGEINLRGVPHTYYRPANHAGVISRILGWVRDNF